VFINYFDKLRLAGSVFQFPLRHRWSSQKSITVIYHLLINLTLLFIVCSQCSMLRPDLFMDLIDLNTSRISCAINFIGCALVSRDCERVNLKCAFWSTKQFMNLRRITLPKCISQLVLSKLADICAICTTGNLIVPATNTQYGQYEHFQSLRSFLGTIYQSTSKLIKLILKFISRIGKLLPVYRQSFFCSAVLTPQHYHWYAATRFAFPGG